MPKTWQIIKYEYHKHVFQKRFLFSLLSLPAAMTAMALGVVLVVFFTRNTKPIGYIDHSGVLQNPIHLDDKGSFFEPVISFMPYKNEELAMTDLRANNIQAYYVIPEVYPLNLTVNMYFLDQPDTEPQRQFNQFILQNLGDFADLDPEIEHRLQEDSTVFTSTIDGSRQMREDQWFTIFTPFMAGVMFLIVVMTSGGYLLQAVVEEKENRTMEILVTSVSPNQLMTGKIIGNIAVGLTQLIIWLIFGWLALFIGTQFFPILQDFSLPTNYIIVLLLVLMPSFIMVAAIMAAIGSTMTEMTEAQQISTLFSLPITIPFYLVTPIMMNPNGTLPIILSFFPLTAPITLLMRMGFTVVPAWQIAIIVTSLILCSMLAVWFAGRAFRMGMLRYGKKLSIMEVLRNQVSS